MNEKQLTGNRGEWSEIYVFFKLLAEGELYAADADLKRIPAIYYPILKILRNEISGNWEYRRNGVIRIIRAETQDIVAEISIKEFTQNAEILLGKIKDATTRSFSVPEVEGFMRSVKCEAVKANPSEKRDITIQVHDSKTGFEPILGFSIKSKLGSASTLFNASRSTNFTFKIRNFPENMINTVNNITGRSKIRDRIEKILDMGGSFTFSHIDNETFDLNLKLIDSRLPEIISEFLLNFFKGKGNKMADLLEIIKKENPCGFSLDYNHPFYEYKIKNLLTDIALGMTPTAVWNGFYDATGGIIIVREDGEVLCYHIYNRNEFQDYLLQNTKLETPSSTKHKFGKLYKEKGDLFFKLNLQIRFTS